MSILFSLLAASLAAPPAPPGTPPADPPRHSSANVNHSLSHGTLGDRFLSLNEAIQLHNGTLAFAQLSPGEQGQVSYLGSGSSDVAFIDIDYRQLPTLVMERPLDPILDTPHGCNISGINGTPVLDFAGRTFGFVANSNLCEIENLEIRNAAIGVALTQVANSPNPNAGCNLRHLKFAGISSVGVRMRMVAAGGRGDVNIDACSFDGVPTAISIDESGANWSSRMRFSDVQITGAGTGMRARLGPGGVSLYELDRFDVEASGPGVLLERPAGADRLVLCEVQSLTATGAPAFALEGHPTAVTQALLHQLDLTQAPGATGPTALALGVGPLGAQIEGVIEDSRFEGAVIVEAGGGQPMRIDNVLHRGGTCQLGANGAGLSLERVRFEDVAIVTVGAQAVAIAESCVLGTSSIGGTAAAPIGLADSYLSGPVGPQVTVSTPLAQPQLGAFEVTPARPAAGGSLTVAADLPPGLEGYAVLGTSIFEPQLGTYRTYVDPFGAVTLGAVFRLQQSFQVAIPADPNLVGTGWAVQMLVVPSVASPGLPAWSLPPAQRFLIW